MKLFNIISISLVLLYACGNNLSKSNDVTIDNSNLKRNVDASYADGSPAKISYLQETNGKMDTVKKEEFYLNGQKKIEGSLKNNLREGVWTYWYENGKIWSKGTFKNGVSDGKFDIYKDDGSKYMQSCYKNGKPDGCWTFFDKDIKKKEVYFKNDSIIKQIDF
jgi:antitoxin component YwqK of YwqJK toxin-antitoxin module